MTITLDATTAVAKQQQQQQEQQQENQEQKLKIPENSVLYNCVVVVVVVSLFHKNVIPTLYI